MKKPLVDFEALIAAALLPLLTLLFIPLRIFVANTIEFPVELPDVALPLIVVSLLSMALLYGICRFGFWARWMVLVPGLLVFLESAVLFHLAGHRPFNGQLIDWSRLAWLSRLEMAALTVALVLALWVARLPNRNRVFHTAALFALLFQAVALASAAATRLSAADFTRKPSDSQSRYFEAFSRLSRRANVIEIVTDHTQGSLVYEILQADLARYQRSLPGFTLFAQTSGMFPGTYPAVPFLMTGVAPDLGDHVAQEVPFTHEHIQEILNQRSIVQDLKRAGFATYGAQVSTLYCSDGYDLCVGASVFDGSAPRLDHYQQIRSALLRLADLTLFRIAPIRWREEVYNKEQWLLRDHPEEARSLSGTLDYFVDHITAQNDSPGTFNFFHHQGGHPPIQFDGDCQFVGTRKWTKESTRGQLRCALTQLERLVAKLQEKGLYDQTMILMLGDHGSQWPTPMMTSMVTGIAPRVVTSANPLLLVKPPRARGPLTFSLAPAAQGDVPATIAAAFGLDRAPDGGRSVFDLKEDEGRERRYLFFLPDAGIFTSQTIPDVEPFLIHGNLFNPYNWTPPIRANVEDPPTRLELKEESALRFAQGVGRVEEGGWRWVEGRLARVYLAAPPRGRWRLAISCSAPRQLGKQSLTVRFNGRQVARFDRARLPEKADWLRVDLPSDLEVKPANVIELALGQSFQPPEGKREYSLRLRAVALENR